MIRILYTVSFMLLLHSCAVQKHLPDGAYLYNGAKVSTKKAEEYDGSLKQIKKELKNSTFPQKNKMILGYPYKVAWWYAIGAPKREKGFKHWLRNRFGEAPVFYSMSDLRANEENLVAIAENNGYFNTVVKSSTHTKGYKRSNKFEVSLPQPYTIDTVQWVLDTSVLSRDILRSRRPFIFLKKDDRFQLSNMKADAERVDRMLKRRGYYYFNDEFIKAYVDTTVGDHKMNLFFSIRKDAPLEARMPQRINEIILFPNYSLLFPPPDTSRSGLKEYKGVLIRDTVNQFRPGALVQPLTYDTGSIYNVSRHDESLSRFMNMGVFKFVKTRYEIVDSTNPTRMNVYYYFTTHKKKSIVAEIGGFTKSNSFTGAQANVNWLNRNIFKGAEQFNVKVYGAFELSANDSLNKNNNWRLGSEMSLVIPRFVTPFRIRENSYFPPFTRFKIGYEWMRRQLLFTRHFFNLQYDITWKESRNKEHTLAPVSITYTKPTSFTNEYLEKINRYPVLQYANLPELILGTFYNYSFTSKSPRAKNQLYFNGNADVGGNVAGLFNKASEPFSKKIANAYFAQYVKLDLDLRFTHHINRKVSWANRLNIGAGLPYGNSFYLPFAKQFTIGGANSLRGFRPRQLGPGRVLTTADQQVAYPQIGGDYKLELQTELRFPIVSIFNGALFSNAGNIWMHDEFLYGPEGKFSKNFLKDLAVDAGFGLRLDLSILIVRLDLGIPLRKPWYPRGEEWVLDEIDFSSKDWRRSNLIFNIGIGYPF